MKEVTYILQTNSSIVGEWMDTYYKYKNKGQAKINLMGYRKTALEVGSTSIFRIIEQTRKPIYQDES